MTYLSIGSVRQQLWVSQAVHRVVGFCLRVAAPVEQLEEEGKVLEENAALDGRRVGFVHRVGRLQRQLVQQAHNGVEAGQVQLSVQLLALRHFERRVLA